MLAVYSVAADGTGLQAVYAPHALLPNGVAGAAPFSAASAGSLITAYGINLIPVDRATSASAYPLPDRLEGVRVYANARPLPIVSVTPWQVNAQIPQDVPAVDTNFQIDFPDHSASPVVIVNVKAAAPAVFATGSTYAVILDPLCPPCAFYAPGQAAAYPSGTAVLADQAHPATAGETLEIYGIGLGPTNPSVAGGFPSPSNPPAQAIQPIDVTIGGQPAQVLFAGLAPGTVGVYQVNVIVPSDLAPGAQDITWSLPGATPQPSGILYVQ